MNVDQIVDKFLKDPNRMKNGSKRLQKMYDCSGEDIDTARRNARISLGVSPVKTPKILLLDIETAPAESYIWSLWNENLSYDFVTRDWFMLTWAAKWLFDNETMSDKLTSSEAVRENDKRIVKSIYNLLDEADIIIAHNGDRFDVPKMNVRFLYHEMTPPSPYRRIDTLRIAKREFRFMSNRLDSLGKFLGIGSKIKTDFDLWKNCRAGDEQALQDMETYNIKDVILLEDIFVKLRPWVHNFPNLGVYDDSEEPRCHRCLSTNIKEKGVYATNTGIYSTYVCKDCGGYSKGRANLLSKEKKVSLMRPLAR